MTHRHALLPSPIGPLTLVVDDVALAGLLLPDHSPPPDRAGFGEQVDPGDPAVAPLAAAVLAYLQGCGPLVVPLAEPSTGTPFQRRVWAQVSAIPYGQTRTYGEVAAAAGHPGAHRAVGSAVARNPVCLAVPCHRVVGGRGGITGYAGGAALKRWLLDMEACAGGSGSGLQVHGLDDRELPEQVGPVAAAAAAGPPGVG
jgi:methylated-DNA-[protein]-cysteine S-methyltransferase